MIEIRVDDREVRQLLNDLSGRGRDMLPVMRQIAGIMKNAVEENFREEGRPKWTPSKRAQKTGGKTLQDTGSLAASVTARADAKSAAVGTNKKYAAIHQFGGRAGRGRKVNIPARPFLKLTDSDLEDIKKALENYLKP